MSSRRAGSPALAGEAARTAGEGSGTSPAAAGEVARSAGEGGRLHAPTDPRWFDLAVERWQAEPLFSTQRGLDAGVRESERQRRLGHSAAGLCHSLRVTGLGEMPSYWQRLAEIQCPVTVLAGALDARFCGIAAAIVRQLPNGYFAEVPEAGHNLLLERPEAVASAIAKGLRS